MCQLCTIIQIPDIFSSGSLAHLHSLAHIAVLQHRLAEALNHRYNHSYNSADVDESIDLCRHALIFLNELPEHISPVSAMACMGAALYVRHSISAQKKDLVEGFELLHYCVNSRPTDASFLANFGQLLIRQYLVSGSLNHLDESLAVLHRAHDLRIGHPARGKICRVITAAMVLENQRCGDRMDFCLEAVIENYKEVLLWQPLGHHSHFEGWDGLCMAFRTQFTRSSDIHFLSRAIHCGQTACGMLSPQHPRAFRYSANLAGAFGARYEALRNPADLELALFHAKHALDLGPPDRRPILLRTLVNIMTSAAGYSGDVEVLSEGISLAREALGCVHESEKFVILGTLGECLIVKASHFGDIEDLKEGIHCMREMLQRVDEQTVHYIDSATCASEALLQYYEMNPSQHFHGLNEAVDLLERLRDGTIYELDYARVLHCTAKAYRARFYHSGFPGMLKSAFAMDQQALDLRQPGHPLRCMSLAALSEDLVQLSMTTEHLDPGHVISMLNEALRGLAEGHPDLFRVTVSLAKLLLIPDTPHTNVERALSSLSQMLRKSPGSAYRSVVDMIPILRTVETIFAMQWIAEDPTRKQCVDVYQAVIDVLPRLASLDMDLPRRIQVLSQARDLATKASSHAVALKQYGRAIELLESGRAVFWAQHLRLRTSFESLDTITAKELRDISRRLEATANPNISLSLDHNLLPRARMERLMNDGRRLSARFDQLVDGVRSQPGMERFMRNLDYKDLSLAATHGPVVILQPSCMCVITTPHVDPHILLLQGVTDDWLQGAVNTLRLTARNTRNRMDNRGARKRPVNAGASFSSDEYDVLADIWRRIVQPLLDFLGWEVSPTVISHKAAANGVQKREGRKRPRLFLCPTGIFAFLPIHAAGLYDPTSTPNSRCLSDFCVVSYTPTLTSLIASRAHSNQLRREEGRFLIVAVSDPYKSIALPEARKEADVISQIVPRHLIISTAMDERFSVDSVYARKADDVLRLMPEATILHLACHGIQNTKEPLKSGFIMHDKMMEVSDLMRLNLPNAHLAFLSACETAQGDMERPDEALHLAATMLYAGFKSVIGTMWSMGDVDGPVVAKTVYEEIFADDGEMLDFDVVPYALDDSVRKLRAQGLEPSRWAPYIHIGM
jgi:hypothetical protein